MEKLRIVVSGFIGLYPSGGVTWDYIQYPLGFHLLGHDVYYIEDTMQYSRYQSPGQDWDDASDSVRYLKQTMEHFGLAEKWAYRDVASGKCFGLPISKVLEVCATADIFINVSASAHLRDEYLRIPKRILIDSDPMFTQVQDWDDDDPEKSSASIKTLYNKYNYLFSFGENINKSDCRIPTFDFKWEVTRQPICLDYWKFTTIDITGSAFTTIMNWSTRKKMKYLGEEWGQKDVEFEKFRDLPQLYNLGKFDLIVADSSKSLDQHKLRQAGWNLFDPLEKIKNFSQYQDFIEASAGEFSVAKQTYVKSNSGWFSCRSACYLAAGKPVIAQETRWSKYIPSGLGLFSFHDLPSALDALHEVTSDIEKHSKAAREVAIEYFDSQKVLSDFLNKL